ncbi:hypothetical protein K450DRAFT_253942 [Umbelopsis ramanniana AG]|uniref:Autophagy-related protein 13 n=1 Tax=Umbelopsis ramanniana AG TaxID=1314678 RepID=A0AAD5HCB7_UMBRA|nr:uncharacterized protein K450DRAFT_253942 [Umbelopsis ramanniana AG]KAI8577008.1 hypothetical protein K450DRAFT_253942 [Umbelopsis ramanniana AG]
MPGSVKAAVVEKYNCKQPIHNRHTSSSSHPPPSLIQVAASCLEISFGVMPISYEATKEAPSSSSKKDSHFDSHEFLCKLAHIILRARIPSDQLHSKPTVSSTLSEAWTSGWPVHVDIYKQDILLERWITSLDTSHVPSRRRRGRHGTHQDHILLLQSVYAHTRLMPIHPLLCSNTLCKDELSYNVTSSETPSTSPRLAHHPPTERREFKPDAQLKVFQFQRVHMTQLGVIQLEVVFDEHVGDPNATQTIEHSIESLHLDPPPADYFGMPIPETPSKRKATSPFPSPGQSQRMMNRSLHRHVASHLAKQHTKPVVQLTFSPSQDGSSPQRAPSPASSNLANLFSQHHRDDPPPDHIPSFHPLQLTDVPTSIPHLPLSPPRTTFFAMPMAQSSIAKRRLSRLSISAMEQHEEDTEKEDDINIPLATSPSMQYTHQGRTVAYSTSPSSHIFHHPTADLKHLHVTRRSSLVHHTPTRRNSLGLPHGELFGSLVGSYEESILNGRMSTLPSKPITFHAQIGVLGHGPCKPSLRCPSHVTLVFPSFFYELEDSDLPTPYVGTIDLEGGLTGDRFKRKPGYYRLPPQGQIQIVIKNPNKTAVKLFLVPYDLCDMPAGTKTFLRQKSFGLPDDQEEGGKLRYAIHLQVCCSEKKHLYLFKHIRVVFSNRASSEKLRVVCEDPGVPKYLPLSK